MVIKPRTPILNSPKARLKTFYRTHRLRLHAVVILVVFYEHAESIQRLYPRDTLVPSDFMEAFMWLEALLLAVCMVSYIPTQPPPATEDSDDHFT